MDIEELIQRFRTLGYHFELTTTVDDEMNDKYSAGFCRPGDTIHGTLYGALAHGDTIEEAVRNSVRKLISDLTIDELCGILQV